MRSITVTVGAMWLIEVVLTGTMVESFMTSPALVGSRSLAMRVAHLCSATSKDEEGASEEQKPKEVKPDILEPFLPAADPMYAVRGPVGEEKFILSRNGKPRAEELTNENLLKILMIECSDLEVRPQDGTNLTSNFGSHRESQFLFSFFSACLKVNTLVWKCLGYRFDAENETWTNEEVFPNWKEKHPTPPDLIGMQRIYSREVDRPSLKANQDLVRSVPVDNKQSLKTHLKPYGFRGYKVSWSLRMFAPLLVTKLTLILTKQGEFLLHLDIKVCGTDAQ